MWQEMESGSLGKGQIVKDMNAKTRSLDFVNSNEEPLGVEDGDKNAMWILARSLWKLREWWLGGGRGQSQKD